MIEQMKHFDNCMDLEKLNFLESFKIPDDLKEDVHKQFEIQVYFDANEIPHVLLWAPADSFEGEIWDCFDYEGDSALLEIGLTLDPTYEKQKG